MEQPDTGLSTFYSSSQEVTLHPATVEFRVTGNLASVKREMVEKPCCQCGKLFKVLKRKSRYVHRCKKCTGSTKGKQKDTIVHTFSAGSRRHLMRLLATVSKGVQPVLITLTFPDTYTQYREPEDWKRLLRAFEHRFRRAFQGGSYIWRLEVIDRKSGEHVGEPFPHFHLLVFGVPFQQLRRWVPGVWYEVVGTGDIHHLNAGTQVSPILSRKGMFRYASKTVGNLAGELGKDVQTAVQDVGRWWGVLMETFKAFQSAVRLVELTEQQALNVLRAFRHMSHAGSRDYPGMTTFIDGGWLGRRLGELAEPVERKNSFKTGRRYDTPFYKWAYDTGRWVPAVG